MTETKKLSPTDIATITKLLAQLEPGFLPYELFIAVARLVVLPILEFVPLRIRKGKIEVLMLQKQEAPFTGLWHTPGTVIRATDVAAHKDGVWPPMSRIQDEIGGIEIGLPYFVGNVLHQNDRGAEQAQVFWVEVVGEPKIGAFFAVDSLPQNIIGSQEKFIAMAVKSFAATHK